MNPFFCFEKFTVLFSLKNVLNYKFNDHISFLTYLIILNSYKDCFDFYELIVIGISLVESEKKVCFKRLFQITHLIYFGNFQEMLLQFINLLIFSDYLINPEFIKLIFSIIFLEYKKMIFYGLITLFSIFLQVICLRRNVNTNLKRKIFHFCAMIVYFNNSALSKILGQFLILLLILSLQVSSIKKISMKYRSKRDCGIIPLSHIIFLSSVCYSSYFLQNKDYKILLIIICVLDSLTSILGEFFRLKKKSITISFTSIFISLFVSYFISGIKHFNLIFFMGLSEFILKSNDNIFLPFLTIFFIKKL